MPNKRKRVNEKYYNNASVTMNTIYSFYNEIVRVFVFPIRETEYKKIVVYASNTGTNFFFLVLFVYPGTYVKRWR